MTTGAGTEEIERGFLDAILGLAARAVALIVELIVALGGWRIERGDDAAGSLRAVLQKT